MTRESDTNPSSVALALGGGGARGLAHIGVLRALEERGIAVEAIAGCSMGGIIGALIGSDQTSADIADIVRGTHFHDLLDFGARGGLVGGKGIGRVLAEHVREDFEALGVPLKVTTVDVQRGSLVILGTGPLVPALQATSALPGILSPVEHMDRVLIDGGILNNLPIDVVRTMSLAPIVAVDVAAPHDRRLDFDRDHGFVEAIKRISRREFRTLTVELFMKSFDIPQRLITDTRLAMDPPEMLVRPELDVEFGVEDMHRLEEAIELGYHATNDALDRWIAEDGSRPEWVDDAGEED
ncbi:MAG TPA: patatin-like phospholipase family protein [Candidatus Krumholzibacteria bacterium]|nr:patatin-like phospholipase family protein [Candidatus Krumholzibacteria bacterium]